ncbi:hypothetical protein Drorol1_Dr00022214 [Drosera rotundifolia]
MAPANILVGSHVWVEDQEVAWIDGEVMKINGEEAEIQTTDGKKVVASLSKIYPKDVEAPDGGVDDMTKLSYLHEPGVLQNLSTRYTLNEIYTYTGNILIAVNPFQRLPHLYDAQMMAHYKGAPLGKLSPHVFAIADVAYRAMINLEKSNSILVSGESGAGKTETTKMLMSYLAYLGGRAGTEGRTVEQQVLEEIEKYKLGHPKCFHYLNQSNCYELVGVSDAQDYLATRRAMDVVGISKKEQDAIFRVVAAILHLGNVEFTKGKEIDSSALKDDKSKFHLQTASELLMCDLGALEDALCKRVIITPEEIIKRTLDPLSASVSRDGLAKTIYSRLFDWLVDKINNSIGQDPNSTSLIGVLDIYGFESFKTNSFEQFCINYTNEKLQQHFNQHVFKMEQEEYTKEQIDWSYIEFVDNQDVLDLIEKKPGGVITLLDEACMFPKSTHETFSQKLYQTFTKHKRFIKPKLSRTDFTIAHYAGEVQYQSDQFLDKNKDYVVPEHQDLLSASKCTFVAGLFPPIPEETTKSSKFSSIGSRFKLQLQQLMETLNSTEPHYIRCVKPNNVLKPAIFEHVNVMQQLSCGGVLEAIRISCAGYPTRRTFFEFINRFKILAPEVVQGSYEEKAACMKILEKMGLKGYQIGITKVFLRAGQMAELDARRAEKLSNSAKIIQRKIRTHITRQKYLALLRATIILQTICRGKLACKLYESMRREAGAITIQKNLRRHLSWKSYKRIQFSAVIIQTGSRSMAARNQFRYKNKTKAATVIQACWRCYKAFSYYKKLKRAALVSQCRWRGRLGRKELRKLKMAARETGALKEAKDKLKKKVEELTWRLQFEKRQRADLEESKEKEILKLQQSLQEMQMKVDEANALVVREREIARTAIEEADATAIKETPVPFEDSEKIERLSAEVDDLKALLDSERQRAGEWERKCMEAHESSEEKRKKLEETEKRVLQLQESLNRVEDRLGNLESENKLLRQQALKIAQTNKLLSLRSRSITQRTDSTRHVDLRTQSLNSRDSFEVEGAAQRALNEKQQENQDLLLRCIAQQLGFSKGRPIAACLIYKCLKQWRSFEVEHTSFLDRIVHTIGHAIEAQDNNGILTYWLSNTSYLLLLLQRTLKVTAANGIQHRLSASATLFGRMTQSFRGIPRGVDLSFIDSEMSGKAPRTSKASSVTLGTAASQQDLFVHWKGLVQSFSNYLTVLKTSYVPSFLIHKLYTQVFSFVNVQLFNSLLLRRECCSFTNAEFVKAGLAELENWCHDTTKEYVGAAWDELKHIRQAIGFLVIHQKPQKTLDEVSHEICPVLSLQQLYRISTMYWDDKYGTHSLSPEVVSSMKALLTDICTSSSFLLDDDSSIPFSADVLAKWTNQISVFDIELPPLIRENSGFGFLLPISD